MLTYGEYVLRPVVRADSFGPCCFMAGIARSDPLLQEGLQHADCDAHTVLESSVIQKLLNIMLPAFQEEFFQPLPLFKIIGCFC